jgi:hypothetical protein
MSEKRICELCCNLPLLSLMGELQDQGFWPEGRRPTPKILSHFGVIPRDLKFDARFRLIGRNAVISPGLTRNLTILQA